MGNKKMVFSDDELMEIIRAEDAEDVPDVLKLAKLCQHSWLEAYKRGYQEGRERGVTK